MPRLARIMAAFLVLASPAAAADDAPPSRDEARAALLKAVRFFHEKGGVQGGYVWAYSGDLAMREAEGIVGPTTAWVQPPGTPAIGEAFLDAYEATGDLLCLEAARA